MDDTTHTRLLRTRIGDERDDKLFFTQVREDPRLELEALSGCLDGPIAIVSSGGCTALSLVAAGATDVVAIDLNRTQNHVVELKAAALARLGPQGALPFVGGRPAPAADRLRTYDGLRDRLSPEARAYWDDHRRALGRGLLTAGKTDRFVAGVFAAVRVLVEPRSRIDALFACTTLDEQRRLYDAWDNRRWRATFHVLFNRFVWSRVLDPAFFEHTDTPSFADYFYRQVEHCLIDIPVRDNYFLHHLLRGTYPVDVEGGVPPYLDAAAADAWASVDERLSLVDGTFLAHLRRAGDGSIAGFSLSNICEWLTPDEIDELVAEVVRTARPGARLCFRNFLGWTDVPDRWRSRLAQTPLGDELIGRDRAMAQRRFVVCDILAP
jgi:S-adenosylmethionine-diacylglycerol 3-amino-3-carboxypropyl transferase